MKGYLKGSILGLALLATQVQAGQTFVVAPSVGAAAIDNFQGYKESPYLRVEGSYYPLPQLALNVFVASFTGFDAGGGSNVSVKINGGGVGVTGRWPLHARVQPFVRLDYLRWNAETKALGRTVAKDQGGSPGLAAGMFFPITQLIGVKTEFSGYNDISGANVRMLSVGATFTF